MTPTPVYPLGIPVHPPEKCDGQPCCFHAPSVHHMVDWPMVVRGTTLVERLCQHGVGHPDPDSIAFFKRTLGDRYERYALEQHGCCGCCVSAAQEAA